MKIERISTRLVKPHSTIDGSPLLVTLSNFDRIFPGTHVEALFAYHAPVPPTMALKEGLSIVLSEYREWAGRLTMDASGHTAAIELNDAGAVFVEAEAHGDLQDLWPFNPSDLLLDLVPINRGMPELLLIQVTRFACGGVTLGVASSHQVADGLATFEFWESWSSVVQGLPIACTPLHDRSALMARVPLQPTFDHLEYQEPPLKPKSLTTKNYPDLAQKRINFSTQLLQKLKVEATKGAQTGVIYSTFVSLAAHIWKCITKARGLEDEESETRVIVSVNVRKWLHPPLPKGYFGNVLCSVCPHAKMKDLVNEPLFFAANIIHEAIKLVNNDYARSALDFIELLLKNPLHIDQTKRIGVLTPNLNVTNWVTLPFYNLDFGWGTPMFAGTPCVPHEGQVIFCPSPKKDGSIDVVLGLLAPDMEKLDISL